MAILTIEHLGAIKAGTLSGRVLIGRWTDNTLVIDDRAVSRVHAWIGFHNGQYYVADASSRAGTIVNDRLLRGRHILCDGDQIRIGPALISFHEGELQGNVEEIDLTPQSAARLSSATGRFFECTCGAPLWLPHGYTGKPRCRYCGHSVRRLLKKRPASARPEIQPPPQEQELEPVIAAESEIAPEPEMAPEPEPTPAPETVPAPVTEPPVLLRLDAERICGICHSPITAFDAVTDCNSCGLPFHSECWEENHGCSAYGCDQVGALDRRNAG